MRAARTVLLLLITGLAATAVLVASPLTAQEEQQDLGKSYAGGARMLDSRVIVNAERYLKGVQRLQVSPELLGDFVPDYIEFYLNGELVSIDNDSPWEASIDVGAYTKKHNILIVAVREIVLKVEQPDEQQAEGVRKPSQGTFKVVITSPVEGNYVVGRTAVSVEAEFEEEGARLEAVQVYVDDELVGTISGEPWELIHDFGRKFNARRVSIVALDNLGRQASAAVTTAPLERSTFFVEARVITLDVTVTDGRGKLVGGLEQEDFTVFENGQEQEVRYFSNEERPLWVAILVDTSGSMHGAKIRRSVFAAQQFISQLKPADHAMVVTFGPAVEVVSEFTNDFDSLIDATGGIGAIRDALTPLNQSIHDTMDQFKDRVGRRAIIVISDGADTASTATADQVNEAAKAADVRIYGIGIRRVGMQGNLGSMNDPGIWLLRGLADTTGGDSYFPTSTSEFLNIFKTIADELRSNYSLGYIPPQVEDNTWRNIDVKMKRRDLDARTRKGYYPEER